MRLLSLMACCFAFSSLHAQQNIIIKIKDGDSKASIAATVYIKELKKGFAADSTGIVSIPFPAIGNYNLKISSVGFEEQNNLLRIPSSSTTIEFELTPEEHEMEDVIVQSTRTSRTIPNVPTRVETIEFEEIDEKTNMRPANVAMLLHESTGIQVQQTSATSANAGIRIQGLDGRYTQLLKDGFANYGNFSSGLSVLEIPPLDLKQVEIIKGPASPLFGGGAIAGVVNFISKTPGMKAEYNFILNQSNIGQTNIGAFAMQRSKKIGYSLLALYNRQKIYDVDDDEFTEVPKTNEYTIHPKLFFYPNEHTIITLGNSLTQAERMGGDVQVIKNKPDVTHQYFEKNVTKRNITTVEYDNKISASKRLLLKQSFSFFDRTVNIPNYEFAGVDYTSFSDVSYVSNRKQSAMVLGATFNYNRFREKGNTPRNNTTRTGGVYAQHTWDASEKIKLESGLRLDVADYENTLYHKTEFFFLPRVSLLIKYNEDWTSRIGGGMGYRTPTLFTEEAETIQYQNVAQLNDVRSEKSYGATADVNFRTALAPQLAFTFNHMFFYTTITHPLVLHGNGSGMYSFVNVGEPVNTGGFETNARFIYKKYFKLFLGYTYTHASAEYRSPNTHLPLVPRSKLNAALIYEKEGVIKIGLEGYWTGKQYLSNGTRTPAFSEFGFMAEKIFRKFSLFINLENFTDTRQSRYKNVVNGSHLNPNFDEIWNHTEGFVMNGGVKLRL